MSLVAKFLSLSFAEAALRGSRFVLIISFANSYGSSLVGAYGYYTSIFSILFVLFELGLGVYATKEIASNTKNRDQIYQLLWLRQILVSSIFLLIAIFLYLKKSELSWIAIVVAMIFLSDLFLNGYFALKRGVEDFKKESFIKLLFAFFYVAIGFFSFFTEPFFIFLSMAFFSIFVSSAFFIKEIPWPKPFQGSQFDGLFLHLKSSFSIYLGGIFSLIYLRVDILMLEYYLTLKDVGVYTIASRLFELILVVQMAISIILLPKASKNSISFSQTIAISHFVLGIFIAAIFWIVSKPIISLILTDDFSEASPLLRVMLIGFPFLLFTNYIFTILIARGFGNFYAKISMIMLILNICLNFIAIPIYGSLGAAITTVMTEIIGMLLGYKFALKRLKD